MDQGGKEGSRREWIVSSVYAVLFASIAPLAAYLNLYLQRKGLTDTQIGSVAAVMGAVGIIAPPLWGYLSDRWGNRGLLLALSALGSALFFLGFLAPSFPSVLLIAALFAAFNTPLIPLLDATVLEGLKGRRERYARLRVWGSWGFVGTMALFGLLLPEGGQAEALLPALWSFLLLRLSLVGLTLALTGGQREGDEGKVKRRPKEIVRLFTDRHWLLFLFITFLSVATNRAFYTFFPLYLNRAGIGDNWQGYFWVIGVLAEIAFMTRLVEGLIRRIGLKGLLLMGVAGRARRFGLYAFPIPFPILLACQFLHALTFAAAHTASVTWVSLMAPPGTRALTQTLYASVLLGVGGALGAQLGGIISEVTDLYTMFGLAGGLNFFLFLIGWVGLKEPAGSPKRTI